MKNIVVITEYVQGKVHPITGEVMAAAHSLSAITGDEILMVCMRSDGPPDGERQKKGLLSILKGGDVNPAFIVMGHTVQGIDLAPRLAVGLDADCISGVHEIREHQGQPAWVRSLFKGKADSVLTQGERGNVSPVVLTVQPGSFHDQWDADDDGREVKMDWETLPRLEVDTSEFRWDDDNDIQYGEYIQNHRVKSTLGEARTIVAAGRGIESRENLEKIQQLAECFQNASVAGSRPLIDMGWMPYANQVGITGAVVAPDLYLALGISGSSQHLAGMAQSKFIVSVNKDPNAAIFNVSDICIVEDTLAFIEKLISLTRG